MCMSMYGLPHLCSCMSVPPAGHITSGAPSPTLGKNVAMGYIASKYAKAATPVVLQVRQRKINSATAKMPFVPARYFTASTK